MQPRPETCRLPNALCRIWTPFSINTVTAWGALAGSVLSRKHNRGVAAGTRYAEHWMQGMMSKQARTDPIVTALEAVARETGRTLAQVALSWLRTWPVPVIPIRSARRVDQFQDNLASLTLSLIPEQVKTLDAASAIEIGFPERMYQMEMVGKLAHAGMRERILA